MENVDFHKYTDERKHCPVATLRYALWLMVWMLSFLRVQSGNDWKGCIASSIDGTEFCYKLEEARSGIEAWRTCTSFNFTAEFRGSSVAAALAAVLRGAPPADAHATGGSAGRPVWAGGVEAHVGAAAYYSYFGRMDGPDRVVDADGEGCIALDPADGLEIVRLNCNTTLQVLCTFRKYEAEIRNASTEDACNTTGAVAISPLDGCYVKKEVCEKYTAFLRIKWYVTDDVAKIITGASDVTGPLTNSDNLPRGKVAIADLIKMDTAGHGAFQKPNSSIESTEKFCYLKGASEVKTTLRMELRYNKTAGGLTLWVGSPGRAAWPPQCVGGRVLDADGDRRALRVAAAPGADALPVVWCYAKDALDNTVAISNSVTRPGIKSTDHCTGTDESKAKYLYIRVQKQMVSIPECSSKYWSEPSTRTNIFFSYERAQTNSPGSGIVVDEKASCLRCMRNALQNCDDDTCAPTCEEELCGVFGLSLADWEKLGYGDNHEEFEDCAMDEECAGRIVWALTEGRDVNGDGDFDCDDRMEIFLNSDKELDSYREEKYGQLYWTCRTAPNSNFVDLEVEGGTKRYFCTDDLHYGRRWAPPIYLTEISPYAIIPKTTPSTTTQIIPSSTIVSSTRSEFLSITIPSSTTPPSTFPTTPSTTTQIIPSSTIVPSTRSAFLSITLPSSTTSPSTFPTTATIPVIDPTTSTPSISSALSIIDSPTTDAMSSTFSSPTTNAESSTPNASLFLSSSTTMSPPANITPEPLPESSSSPYASRMKAFVPGANFTTTTPETTTKKTMTRKEATVTMKKLQYIRVTKRTPNATISKAEMKNIVTLISNLLDVGNQTLLEATDDDKAESLPEFLETALIMAPADLNITTGNLAVSKAEAFGFRLLSEKPSRGTETFGPSPRQLPIHSASDIDLDDEKLEAAVVFPDLSQNITMVVVTFAKIEDFIPCRKPAKADGTEENTRVNDNNSSHPGNISEDNMETMEPHSRYLSWTNCPSDKEIVHGCINSHVIQVGIVGKNMSYEQLPDGEHVNITLRTKTLPLPGQTKQCVYWKPDKQGWASNGCELVRDSGEFGLDVCRCNHLTHFAQLVTDGDAVSGPHEPILRIASICACVVSLVALAGVMAAGILAPKWRRKTENKVMLNLCVSMALYVALFLRSALAPARPLVVSACRRPAPPGALCQAAGAALHYFVLASFCWMLVAAAAHLLRFTTFTGTQGVPRFALKAALLGWGAPAVPVAVLLGVDADTYRGRGRDFCYPTSAAFYGAVLAPICAVLLANATIFVLVVRRLFARTCACEQGPAPTRSGVNERREHARKLIVCVAFTFLFGLTWYLGVMSYSAAPAYVFCVAVMLQGPALLVFFVLGEENVRNSLKSMRSGFRKAPLERYTGFTPSSAHSSVAQRTVSEVSEKLVLSQSSSVSCESTSVLLPTRQFEQTNL